MRDQKKQRSGRRAFLAEGREFADSGPGEFCAYGEQKETNAAGAECEAYTVTGDGFGVVVRPRPAGLLVAGNMDFVLGVMRSCLECFGQGRQVI